jgi:cell division transport system permease protein
VSIAVLLSCLVVMGCFSMLVFNIDRNLDSLGDLNEIAAFVSPRPKYGVNDTVTVAPAVSSANKTFLGWSTDPDATVGDLTVGGRYTVDAADAVCGVITFYAIWEGGAVKDGCTLSYHASGVALDSELPVDTNTYTPGTILTLPEAPIPRYRTIEFRGWALSPSPDAATYAAGSEYVVRADDIRGGKVTLYAIWSEMPAYASYSVVYDGNGVAVTNLPTDAAVRLAAVRAEIEGLDNVADDGIKFISKEEALEEEKEKLKDYPGLLASLTAENNPYPDTFLIRYENNEDVAALQSSLESIDGVYKVSCRADIASSIESLKNGIILVFSWFMIILFAVSLFVIINTVKLAVVSRSKEITIMRYVGATKWFIALPFDLEGVFIGLFSGGLAYLVQRYAYGYVQKTMAAEFGMIEIIPFEEIKFLLLAGCLAVGVITGLIGSAISIRKYLKA